MKRMFGVAATAAILAVTLTACDASTGPTTNITSTSATLNATGSCVGGTPTPCEWYWKWGTGGSYQNQSAIAGPFTINDINVPLTYSLTGLLPNTTYNWQLCGEGDTVSSFICLQGQAFTTAAAGTTTTTTTTVPPTTTTTTQPSGSNCVSVGGSFPGYATPSIYQSSQYSTYVQYQDVGVSNLTGTMCDPAHSGAQWSFSAKAAANDGSVQAFPDVQQLISSGSGYPALSSFNTLTATFNATNPPDAQGNWEQAFDIWLGGYSNDIMIWVNTSNERGASSSYGGSTIDNSNVTIGSANYTLIHYGTTQPERMLVLNTPENSGTVDIKAALNYLVSIGDIPSTVGVAEINFGWEICHTDGQTLNYALNSYSLSAS